MKRTLTLLAVTMITVNSVGCCCCSGLRNWCFPGAYYGPTAAVAPTPLYATMPAPGYAAAPTSSVPVFSHCTPGSPCGPAAPQYALAAPAPMAYSDAGCGTPYMTEMGCGTPYMTEMGCGYGDGMYSDGMIMSSPDMYPGPGPE